MKPPKWFSEEGITHTQSPPTLGGRETTKWRLCQDKKRIKRKVTIQVIEPYEGLDRQSLVSHVPVLLAGTV